VKRSDVLLCEIAITGAEKEIHLAVFGRRPIDGCPKTPIGAPAIITTSVERDATQAEFAGQRPTIIVCK
jgi:hypothetical protein